MNDLISHQTFETTNAPGDFPISSGAFLPEEFNISPVGEKFVVFFLNGQPFGISAKTIAEVSHPAAVAAVPNAPEWLSGIANLRGEVISVINLPKLLRSEELTLSVKSKFIILHVRNCGALIAFTIERPGEIIFITTNEIEKINDDSAPFISGKTSYAEGFMKLIDVEKLVGSLAFN